MFPKSDTKSGYCDLDGATYNPKGTLPDFLKTPCQVLVSGSASIRERKQHNLRETPNGQVAKKQSTSYRNLRIEKERCFLPRINSGGFHTEEFDDVGKRVSSGVYFYRLSTSSFDQMKRMIILK